MVNLSRFRAVCAGISTSGLCCEAPHEDPYDVALDMLDSLDAHLSQEFKGNSSLRFHGISYLVRLRECRHATWKDYANGVIGDKELAFVVEQAARQAQQKLVQLSSDMGDLTLNG